MAHFGAGDRWSSGWARNRQISSLKRCETYALTSRLDEKIDAKVDSAEAELRSEINSLRADVAADFATLRKETGEQIAGLRRAVVEYHSAVLGHGVLVSDLEARARRMEQHLDLPPMRGG